MWASRRKSEKKISKESIHFSLDLISGSWEQWKETSKTSISPWRGKSEKFSKMKINSRREFSSCTRLYLWVKKVKRTFQDLLMSVKRQEWKILIENFHLTLDLTSGPQKEKQGNRLLQDLPVSIKKQEWKIFKENFNLVLDLMSQPRKWIIGNEVFKDLHVRMKRQGWKILKENFTLH